MMTRQIDVSIIIPVYNEEASIGRVVDEVLAVDFGGYKIEIIVVSDGSTDKTDRILVTHPQKRHFKTVTRKINGGKGLAVRAGITRASGRAIIIQDADFEYNPREIPKLVEPILAGETAVVYGSRFKGKIFRMTLLRRLANRSLTRYVNFCFDTKISDACTCYKVFDGELIKSFHLTSCGFEFCHELTANVARHKLKIKDVPISYTARTVSENIKSNWFDFVKQLIMITYFRLRRMPDQTS